MLSLNLRFFVRHGFKFFFFCSSFVALTKVSCCFGVEMFVDWRFLCGRSVVFVLHSGCGLLTLAGQGPVVSGWWWGFGARRASARARYARPSHHELLEHLVATDTVMLQNYFHVARGSCAVVSLICYGFKDGAKESRLCCYCCVSLDPQVNQCWSIHRKFG